MDYFDVMKSLEAHYHLIKDTPYVFFFHVAIALFEVVNFGLEISSVSEFHYNIKSLCVLFKEGFFVSDDVRVID
jgi:hypothetical protein